MVRDGGCWVLLVVGSLLFGLTGCRTGGPHPSRGQSCGEIEGQIHLSDRIGTLNRLADAFVERCYDSVIAYGEKARTEFRHKTFSFIKETGNVFVPEGSFIDYVLESYEGGI